MTKLDSLLDALERAGLIKQISAWPEHVHEFRHNLIQEAAYASLLISERKQIHLSIARVMERIYSDRLEEFAPVLGRHFMQAGEDDSALKYFGLAAANAASIHAHQEAEKFYAISCELAIRLNRPNQELTGLFVSRGRMMEHAGRFADALELYQDLEEMAAGKEDPLMACTAVTRQAFCFVEPTSVHNLDQAKPLISKGLTLASELDAPDLEVDLLWSLMVQETHYGNSEKARQLGERCLQIAREHLLQSQLARVLHDMGLNLRLSGELEKGEAYALESRELFRKTGNLSMLVDSLNQQALMDILHLDLDSSLTHTSEAYDISQRIDNGWNLAYATWLQGMVSAVQGQWGIAQEKLRDSMDRGGKIGFLMSLITVPLQLGDLLRQLGYIDEAYALHLDAHREAKKRGPFMLKAVEVHLAMDAFLKQDLELGKSWMESARNRDPLGEIGTALDLHSPAEALVFEAEHTGGWQGALVELEKTIGEARQRHLNLSEMYLLFNRGLCLIALERLDEAEKQLLDVLAITHEAGIVPLQWRINLKLTEIKALQESKDESYEYGKEARRLRQILAETLSDPAQIERFLSSTAIAPLGRSDHSKAGE